MFMLIKLLIYLKLINNILASGNEFVVHKDSMICLSCPAINNDDNEQVTLWYPEYSNGDKKPWLCRNQKKFTNDTNIIYACNNNKLCLYDYKANYPTKYTCMAGPGTASVYVKYLVQLRYMSLIAEADYINIEGSKLTVKENTELVVTCEISETNPKSTIRLTVGNQEYASTSFRTKKFEDDLTLVYTYNISVKRDLQGKNIVCEAKIDGFDDEMSNKLDIRTYMMKKYTLDVQYIPVCGNNNYLYNTGYNQSIVMECKVSSANPTVTSYQLAGPTDSTAIENIEENGRPSGKFIVKPKDKKDLGKYECYPRNNAGTAKCVLNLILGGPPDPPYDCTIGYNRNSNKTTAQIHCQLGFNQNGTRSDFVVYERLRDGTVKHAGSINAYDSNMKSADYLTKEIDEFDYYEFVVMQTNNFGNSSAVVLSIGTKAPERSTLSLSKNTLIGIVAGSIGGLILICLCCCCATNACSSGTSDQPNSCMVKYCSCCYTNLNTDDKNITYKKTTYQEDLIQSYMEDDQFKEDTKYISTENGLIYKPMLTKTMKLDSDHDNNDDNQHSDHTDTNDDINNSIYKLPLSYQMQQQSNNNNNLINSFRNELNFKLKQRNEIDTKLNHETQIPTQKSITFSNTNATVTITSTTNNKENPVSNSQTSSYESTSSTSSSTSNNDLLNSNNNLINNNTINRKEKPPILKPKPRLLNTTNYSMHYGETSTSLLTTTMNNSSSSPSTSVTDISTCTPKHGYDKYISDMNGHNNDKYPIIPSRTNSLRPKQRPPIPPPIPPPVITTTFDRYITKQYNETTPLSQNDVNYVNNNKKTLIRNSDC